MHAMWVMIGVLAVLAVAYRTYSAFLAARVATLDDARVTPAHVKYDGQNYDPTNRWVLFGHHFAAISGAGPLIGPVLAIQFGYLPGLIWLVVGVCLAGAVQDFLVLTLSTRRGGLSLAGLARREVGPVASGAAAVAILYVIVIALAGLGIIVVKALGGEEVAMPAGSRLVLDAAAIESDLRIADGVRTYHVAPGSEFLFDPKDPARRLTIHEGFTLSVPAGKRAEPAADEGRTALVLPAGAKRLVPGSAWGTFTIACTIPIALLVGFYMYRVRKGKVFEASLLGAVLVLGAVVAGAWVPGSPIGPIFTWSDKQTIVAMAIYGFVAAILPVWLLLCPRDYLSSFLKIGTIALLVVGVVLANPTLRAPSINEAFQNGGGPYFDGPIFPYVFICIMCGAISGFHALVSSGTTPKMVDRERDCRPIGYGAMLMEGLVGVVALVAAASLPSGMYYDINIDLARRPAFAPTVEKLAAADPHGHGDGTELVEMERQVGESLHGRTGGAVTLAVGMARILTAAVPGGSPELRVWLVGIWYHFAIMFEALFILTTIDAGTRIGRFMVQEFLGKLWKPLGNLEWPPAAALATALIVLAWAYFIWTNSVDTIWPMFGMANQLLALIALAIATTALINGGKARYALITLAPAAFVATTTFSAAWREMTRKYWGLWIKGPQPNPLKGWLNIGLTCLLLACVVVIVAAAARRWVVVLRRGPTGAGYGLDAPGGAGEAVVVLPNASQPR